MKVLLVSSYDNQGGAARAAYRLHQGLNAIGVDSRMFVQTKTTVDPKVDAPKTQMQKGAALLRPYLDALPLKLCSKPKKPLFSPGILPETSPALSPLSILILSICTGLPVDFCAQNP